MIEYFLAIFAGICMAISDSIQKKSYDFKKLEYASHLVYTYGIFYFIILVLCIGAIFVFKLNKYVFDIESIYDILILPKDSVKYLIMASFFSFLGILAVVLAIKKCFNISYVIALISASINVVALLISIYIFGYGITIYGIIGIFLIIVGCYFIIVHGSKKKMIR